MKKHTQHIAWLLIVITLLATGCKKSEYLTDGGVHDPITSLSNYDYLQQNNWQLFDTLLLIVDHYQLKDEINKAPTFFAPTDFSIARYLKLKLDSVQLIDENLTYTLNDMYKDLSADSVRQYLLGEKVELSNTPTAITPHITKAKTSCAVQKFLQTDGGYYQWGSSPVYSLYYIKVRGTLDDPNNPPLPNDPNVDSRVLCQTTGIGTSSGSTVLHVLANTHVFVRF